MAKPKTEEIKETNTIKEPESAETQESVKIPENRKPIQLDQNSGIKTYPAEFQLR